MYKSLPAKSLLIFLGYILLSYTNSYAQESNWVRSIGGSASFSSNDILDKVEDIAIDKWGNIVVVGCVGGNPKVNGNSVTPGGFGQKDGFIARFDKCGNLLWMNIIGKASNDLMAGVAIDDDGNAYVTGRTSSGQVRSSCKDTVFALNTSITFIAKYDVNGCMKWIKCMNGSSGFPLPRNIKMGSDGKLIVWLRCQYDAMPLFDTVQVGYVCNIFLRMDTMGTIENYKIIDALPPDLQKFEKDEFDNLYLFYQASENLTRNYQIDNSNISMSYTDVATVKIDRNFSLKNYEINRLNYMHAFEVSNNKMYSFGHVELNGIYHGDTTFDIRSKQSPYSDIAYVSNDSLKAILSSQPDTQKVQGLKCEDIAVVENYCYYVLPSSGFLKWGNINMLDFSMFPPSYAVLVKFTKDSLQGSIVDTIPGFVETYQEDFLKVIEADKRGNLYLGGRYAGYLTIGGQTVTPNGGAGSPDGFLMRWGLPCDDTLDALIAPEKPLSLAATASTQTIDINWQDAAQYELGYELYRSVGDTLQWVRIDSLSRNSTDKTDANVQEDIVYWYKVRGFNSGGYSAWSNVDSAVIQKEDSITIGVQDVASIKYMEVYPNPASNNVSIGIYTDYAGNGKLRVLSLEGREYMSGAISLSGGMHREGIATNELSAGVYLIEVQLQNSRMVKRLMIIR